MSRWFRGSSSKAQPPLIAEDEEAHLRQVEDALLLLLNDDIVSAEIILKSADSSFHRIGRGISCFIASILGAETELLRNAATALLEAENNALEDMKRAQKDTTAFRSKIYPPGTEYLLCHAVAQLTGAICAILSGSVVQAISGFGKLRKAFLTLDGIMNIEDSYFKNKIPLLSLLEPRPVTLADQNNISTLRAIGDPQSTIEIDNHKNNSNQIKNGSDTNPSMDASSFSAKTGEDSDFSDIDFKSLGITSHMDIFIHSGSRLCYGILLVVFSMIENPIFNKILYIVGFKGDRERGTLYLWQASRFNNFNSAIAGISILMYYSGFIGFCDILPTDAKADEDLSGYPRAKSKLLLLDMRKRYPESKLWRLEEARMHTYDRDLTTALKILAENSNSNMKQIATINAFELSLSTMFHHDYELMAQSWIQCAELSNWSPTLYAFLTGAAYFELYRDKRLINPKAAAELKDRATTYFRKGPPLSGKQRLMSKQLPFDMYIVRKCQKWEERVKAWDLDLVDTIGVSPIVEMIYLWGGFKKQNSNELQQSINLLAWDRIYQPERHQKNLDEMAIYALVKSCILRNLERYDEAREILKSKILSHDREDFKGHLKDDWTCPNAYYEMACLAWQEKDLVGQNHREKILECEEWLEKAQKFGDSFVLDTRLSMKLTTSIATLRRHRKVTNL